MLTRQLLALFSVSISVSISVSVFVSVSLNNAPFSHIVEPLCVVSAAAECRRWSGEPSPAEGQRLLWVQPDQLGNLPMPAADVPLLPTVLAALLATSTLSKA